MNKIKQSLAKKPLWMLILGAAAVSILSFFLIKQLKNG
jgi:hypothetical protein|tara:strand:- start:5096 stop:5209 length:114 start_codon:yes stop_codon:yes gene_type:complete